MMQNAPFGHKDILGFIYTECLYATSVTPWFSSTVNSGSINVGTGTAKHPGVGSYKCGTAGNGGGKIVLGATSLILTGREKTTIVFQTAADQSTVNRYMGFHDATTVSEPVDGVYCQIAYADTHAVLTGKTAAASTRSTTDTSYNLDNSTWYRLVVELNADATLATYTLYADDSNTVLWTDTLDSNIPTAVTGHGDVCTGSGTSDIYIGYIDYMDVTLNPNWRIV